MKNLIITGVASEQSFDKEGTLFLLVINDGELRLRIGSDAMQQILEFAYAVDELPSKNDQAEDVEDASDDDGVDQI